LKVCGTVGKFVCIHL